MRRAGQKRIVSPATTSATPPVNEIARGSLLVEFDVHSVAISTAEPVAEVAAASDIGSIAGVDSIEAEDRARRVRYLPAAIRKRIESRLPGRVRDLVVRIQGDRVVLEGECATYYTKQLAQHAALGVLEEEEHLENAIVVNVPR